MMMKTRTQPLEETAARGPRDLVAASTSALAVCFADHPVDSDSRQASARSWLLSQKCLDLNQLTLHP